jgi:hypothetical protein
MAQEDKADHNNLTTSQVGLLSKLLLQHNRRLIGMGEESYNKFLADARFEASKPGFNALEFLRSHDSTSGMQEFKEPKIAVRNITFHRLAQPLQNHRE